MCVCVLYIYEAIMSNLLRLHSHCYANACYVSDTVLSTLYLVTHLILTPIR